jgi:hypothetical protein
VDDNVTLEAVRAARDAQTAAAEALRSILTPDQELALESLLDAVETRYRAAWWHLVGRLAAMLPGAGPAIRELAETIEFRIDS